MSDFFLKLLLNNDLFDGCLISYLEKVTWKVNFTGDRFTAWLLSGMLCGCFHLVLSGFNNLKYTKF